MRTLTDHYYIKTTFIYLYDLSKRFKFDSDIFGSDYVSGELFSFCKADRDEANNNKYRIILWIIVHKIIILRLNYDTINM